MKYAHGVRWLLVIMILIGLAGWAVTGREVYTRIGYLGILIITCSYLWSRLCLHGIQIKRESRLQRASMGDIFEEHFEVSVSSWPGSVWLEVLNQSNLPNASGSRLLTNIGTHQKRFYSARTLLIRRGAYTLGPTLLSSSDPFGLFPVQRLVKSSNTLVVLPMTVNIPIFPPPPGLLPGGKTIRQKTMDVTPHAAGIREYVPSDPMKRIHWPSTARRGRFMVKEFEQDPQADIWLFIDAQKEAQFRKDTSNITKIDEGGFLFYRHKISLPCDTFEYIISAAASLGRFFLEEKRAVGLACATSRLMVLSAERGVRQIDKILETLAFLQPEGDMPLMGLVDTQAKLLPLGSGVVLITAVSQPELTVAVERLQSRNLRPVVVLIKQDTFGGATTSDTVIKELINRTVPVCQIGYGDDLGSQLSLPAAYYEQQHSPRIFFTSRVNP